MKRWAEKKKELCLKVSSLLRIWQHITDPDSSFGVISAFRGTYSQEENMKRHNQLKKDIRSLGLGFIEQKSGYSYMNPESGEEVPVEERSFFIPEIDFDTCLKLGRKYKQESVLYKDSEKGFGLFLCSNGKREMLFKNRDHLFTFNKNDVKNAYSQLVKSNNSQKIKIPYIAEY